MKYRKKPVVIDAFQLWKEGEDISDSFHKWCKEVSFKNGEDWWVSLGDGRTITIPTLEGDMTAQPGDYIIKGIAGEFYPCKPDIFEATYELVEE